MSTTFTCFLASVAMVVAGAAEKDRAPIVGFMGVAPEECSEAAGYGATTIEIHNLTRAQELRQALDAARRAGVSLLAKGPGKSAFSTGDGKIDFARLDQLLDDCFAGPALAGDKNFAGWWLVDEPAHPRKFNLEARDLNRLYETVKRHDPHIPMAINFGALGAYEQFMKKAEPGWKFADIVLFTVTRKKLGRENDYVTRQAEIARRIASFDPSARIVPAVAVAEFAERAGDLAQMPSAKWVEKVSMECVGQDVFSGILLYSYSYRPRWMGKNIQDVKNDPAYTDAFKRIFAAARER